MKKKKIKLSILVVACSIILCFSSFILNYRDLTIDQLDTNNSHSFRRGEEIEKFSTKDKLTDSFQLIINQPEILQNATYLTIMDLNITFINETEIINASAQDNVNILIYNNKGFSADYPMNYDLNRFNGWGKEIYIFNYESPGKYFIDLVVQTGLYSYNGTLDSFEIDFSIHFSNSLLGLSNESQTMHISISITVVPYIYLDYILFNSSILGCIFNSSNNNVKTVSLSWGGFSGWWYQWTANVNISDLEVDLYYSVGLVVYENEVFFSPPSNEVFYMHNSITETSTETSESTESNFFFVWSVLSTVIISMRYLLKMRRKRKLV